MAVLDIEKVELTSLQYPVIYFVGDQLEANEFYLVEINGEANLLANEYVVTDDTATIVVGRVNTRQIPLNFNCSFQISKCEIDTNDDLVVLDTGAIYNDSFNFKADNVLRIQQAIYDIILDEEITDNDGVILNIADNGFVPNSFEDGEINASHYPFISIGRPYLTDATKVGGSGIQKEFTIDILVQDLQHVKDVKNVNNINNIIDKIIQTLRSKEHLYLQMIGIHAKSIEYDLATDTEPLQDGNKTNMLVLTLKVWQYCKV